MTSMGKYELTDREKEEFRTMVKEADDLYAFMEREGLGDSWKHDSERFMGFTFIHTKALVRHSITLTKLTRWLRGLTVALILLSLVQIIVQIIGMLRGS